MREIFRKIALATSQMVGSSRAFMVAITIVMVWALSGPLMGFSETWQLLINTFTTIMTFLMVFLIQNTQNRDAKVMQLKLNELIRATKYARNILVDIEELEEEKLDTLQKELHGEFEKIHKKARKRHENKKNGHAVPTPISPHHHPSFESTKEK